MIARKTGWWRGDGATAAEQAQAQADERRQHKSECEHLQRAG
jgi:hypothetical protein